MRTSRLLATPGGPKIPQQQQAPSSSRKAAPLGGVSAKRPLVGSTSSTPPPAPDASLDLERRVQTLAQALKEKTDELHAAHMEICRAKQMVLSLENRASLSPTHRADVTLGNSAFDRKVVTWLVRSGMMNSTSAADEEQARHAKVSAPSTVIPAGTTQTARKVMRISLDLEAEAKTEAESQGHKEEQGGDVVVEEVEEAGEAKAETEVEAEREPDEKSQAVSYPEPGPVVEPESDAEAVSHPEAEATTQDDATLAASEEPGVEQTLARVADAGDGDDSSVDSGFGELGVGELPPDHVRLDEHRLRIGEQTPHSDEQFDDADDNAMALIYSKPGIASSAVYISATDLYMIIMQELLDLKQVLQEGSVLDFHSQGGY